MTGVSEGRVIILLTKAKISYYVDSASLTEIEPEPDWKAKANQSIDKIRKNNIKIEYR